MVHNVGQLAVTPRPGERSNEGARPDASTFGSQSKQPRYHAPRGNVLSDAPRPYSGRSYLRQKVVHMLGSFPSPHALASVATRVKGPTLARSAHENWLCGACKHTLH